MTISDGRTSESTALTELACQFIDLTRTMIDGDPDGQLRTDRVLQFAAKSVSGAEHAGITLVSGRGKPRTTSATDELPYRVDSFQFATGEGPCLQALVQSDIAHADDLAVDQQWPRFAQLAVSETGVRSMLCFRLFLTETERAALNFYALRPQAFDSSSLATGAIFAAYTSLMLLNLQHQDQNMHLQRALESNREIGMALGILMARELHTADEAFSRLRTASQHLHRKLRDIAGEVIHTGALPKHPEHSSPSPSRATVSESGRLAEARRPSDGYGRPSPQR
ncbi:MAG: hypothetical protein JWN95_627 [Frankiales bacterium]|nr:hypothetical protein [Frankiales bacterium]